MSGQPERFLILCVDRDDDLGAKTKIQTPVVGRDAALAAATKLAMIDPEEADANTIFAAIKKHDELAAKGTACEVAIVCGDISRGFDADKRVGTEIQSVVKASEYTGIVLVSDGGEDEQVIPIIQSFKPIVSVQRVTVKHSQRVEETYQILGRYLRMLVFDPHYSRWALGVPGLIFILAGILIVSGHVADAELATLLIIGGAFFTRGFNVDRTVAGMLQRGPTGYMRLFSMATSVLVIIVGIFSGYTSMVSAPNYITLTYRVDAGNYLGGSLNLVWVGIAIYATGALLSHLARESIRWRRDGFVLVMLALFYLPVWTFSQFLIGASAAESTVLLVSYILLGLAAIFALTTAIYPKVRTKSLPERE
jgi:putative membrane protein